MTTVFEESLVAIVRSGGVSIAYPSGMTRFQLASVLHGLVGALFQGELEVAGRATAVAPEIQVPQGVDHRTLGDRRAWPRRKVAKRLQGGRLEVLECDHRIQVPTNWKRHGSRACESCAGAVAASA